MIATNFYISVERYPKGTLNYRRYPSPVEVTRTSCTTSLGTVVPINVVTTQDDMGRLLSSITIEDFKRLHTQGILPNMLAPASTSPNFGYHHLAPYLRGAEIPVGIRNIDEYSDQYGNLIPADHPLSLRALMRRAEMMDIPGCENRVPGREDCGTQRFEQEIAEQGGIHVYWLSTAGNAHVGLFDPRGHEETDWARRATTDVMPVGEEIRVKNAELMGTELGRTVSPEEIPAFGVSIGPGSIVGGMYLDNGTYLPPPQHIIAFADREDKAKAVFESFTFRVSARRPLSFPAQEYIKIKSPAAGTRLTVVLTEDAAARFLEAQGEKA
ncbi:6-phosphogluconolactonase [Candidatus Margulisiibacteriota bacterium]